MWEVDFVPEFEEWFKNLDAESMEAIRARVLLLQQMGPQLPRPYSDILHGSKYSNLKELRASTQNHILRIAYCFDTKRKAFLLTGGDKKGKNQEYFYDRLIKDAESLIEKYSIR